MVVVRKTGEYTDSTFNGKDVQALIPFPLPPTNPPLLLEYEHLRVMELANQALGRLDRLSEEFPSIELLISFYQRKEAITSSQIEGTVSTMTDLLLFEMGETPASPVPDAEENANYLKAMEFGLQRLEELPLSKRLLREIHAVLLASETGQKANPGEFRRIQNAIANTKTGEVIHVPPPPNRLEECMDELELFLNDMPEKMPTLLKAALAHVQFEMIHPFLDGNGRLGRLLITFLLCSSGVLRSPVLYLSLYFKQNRQEYYRLLNAVQTNGDWEAWIMFFFQGVLETANLAVHTAKQIRSLFEQNEYFLKKQGRGSENLIRALQLFKLKPIATSNDIIKALEVSRPTALLILQRLSGFGILSVLKERERGTCYVYSEYLEILNEGTTPTTIP